MYLTATLKLHANAHDRRRLDAALRRWHGYYCQALDAARSRQGDLLRCLKPHVGRDGKQRLVTDGAKAHAFVLSVVPVMPQLHSSARMSLVVAMEEQLKSWLGLYAEWANGGRKTPKPGFPSQAPASETIAADRYDAALSASLDVTTLSEEDIWRAEVTRGVGYRLLPQYFGAATSGVGSQAHMGILRRDDGRYFALLTLFPQGDTLGEPLRRATNRRDRGDVRNLRAVADDKPFAPTDRARASICVPLETDKRTERIYLERATVKSAEVINRDGDYYLHLACEMTDAPTLPTTGAVLAIRRGIAALASWVILSATGDELAQGIVSGKDLARVVTKISANRAMRQAKGRTTKGDRRQGRIIDHHLWSAAHQLVETARQYGVGSIVLLKDAQARKPQRFLQWKHFDELHKLLSQCCCRAGLPAPVERKVYGSWKTCPHCGWHPDDPTPHVTDDPNDCWGCGTARDPEYDLPRLLAWDTLRLQRGDKRPLGEFIRKP